MTLSDDGAIASGECSTTQMMHICMNDGIVLM